jgi:hypothetical protein
MRAATSANLAELIRETGVVVPRAFDALIARVDLQLRVRAAA